MAFGAAAIPLLAQQAGRAGVMNAAAQLGGQTMQLAGRMVPYLPAIGQFFGGDVAGAGITGLATKLAPKGSKTLVGLGASLIAPPVLGAVADVGGKAVEAVTGAVTGAQRESGRSGLTGEGIGFSDADLKKIEQISRATGMSQVDVAKAMLPVSNQYRDADMQRQMQLNQQTAQLTGALNRQLYTAQMGLGAQQQAGETTRTMMTAANPYASSAFQYRG